MLLASLQQRPMGKCEAVPAGHAWHKGPHHRHLPIAGRIGMDRWNENYAIVEHGWVTDNDTDDEDALDEGSGRSELSEDEDLVALTRLVVRQLPHSITTEELREVFEPHGKVLDIYIPQDWAAAEAKNVDYATVDFMYPEQALAARVAVDGMHYHGRVVTVHTPKEEHLVTVTTAKAKQKKREMHEEAVRDDFDMAVEAMAHDNINVMRVADVVEVTGGGDASPEAEEGMLARRGVARSDSPVDGRDKNGKRMKKVATATPATDTYHSSVGFFNA